jgi:secreted trypsin-like serine protease
MKTLIAAAIVAAGAPVAQASATATGTYQTRTRTVSCSWEPRSDYVACATPAMARTGTYLFLNSLSTHGRETGEAIRGGHRMRAGAMLDGASSVRCRFGRTTVHCTNGVNGFKLGRGVRRSW